MHRITRTVLSIVVLPLAAATSSLAADPAAAADSSSEGYVDFGAFTPPGDGGQFVEVNLQHNLLALVARLAAKEEPEVSKLLAGLHSVRVNVVSVNDSNRADIAQRVATARAELARRGWQKVVTAMEENQDVGIYMKTGADDVIEGIAITVLDDKDQAVFVNVVGNIRPEQIAMLADRMDIEPLKHVLPAHGG